MKILLTLIDGLGDAPIPELENKTPLEAAKTPNLDFLAENGVCGQVLAWVEKGKLPTSEDCHLALFGYQPKISNPGRGVLEVLGIGEKISKKDICLRGNFATVDKNLRIIDRRAGRIEKTESLISSLNRIKIEGAEILMKKAFGHRLGIILRGENFSEKVSSNDPKRAGVKVLKILAKDKKAEKTAQILNEFLAKAKILLENHSLNKMREKEGKLPANYLLLRGAGRLKKIKSFQEKYKLKSGFIAGGTLYKGIARYLGMKEIRVEGANGLPNTNLKGKFLAAKRALKKNDFIFLHIKAADNLAEDGNFFGKKEFIERIDKNLKPLLFLKNTLIVVTADHSTCSHLKRHCLEPAPILIAGPGIKASGLNPVRDKKIKGEVRNKQISNRLKKFSEKNCQKGKLGLFNQLDLMPKILSILAKVGKTK
jgi:2,3-bisphosphoglycerate-independent phosphoglycerate mutase